MIKRKGPDLILRDGKPSAVILDLDEYQELLERLEDLEDLRMLEKLRARPQEFKRLEDILADLGSGV